MGSCVNAVTGASAQATAKSTSAADSTANRPRSPPSPPPVRIGPVANQITSLPGLSERLSSESYGGERTLITPSLAGGGSKAPAGGGGCCSSTGFIL